MSQGKPVSLSQPRQRQHRPLGEGMQLHPAALILGILDPKLFCWPMQPLQNRRLLHDLDRNQGAGHQDYTKYPGIAGGSGEGHQKSRGKTLALFALAAANLLWKSPSCLCSVQVHCSV